MPALLAATTPPTTPESTLCDLSFSIAVLLSSSVHICFQLSLTLYHYMLGRVRWSSLTEVHICIIVPCSRQEHLSDHLHVHLGHRCVLVCAGIAQETKNNNNKKRDPLINTLFHRCSKTLSKSISHRCFQSIIHTFETTTGYISQVSDDIVSN